MKTGNYCKHYRTDLGQCSDAVLNVVFLLPSQPATENDTMGRLQQSYEHRLMSLHTKQTIQFRWKEGLTKTLT